MGIPVYYSTNIRGGISLGVAICINDAYRVSDRYVRHEYGHVLQSHMLGPLYLLVIGIPSFIHAWIYDGSWRGYYRFYTERWANKLGGVEIDSNP